jgi:hypothetical protein
MEIKNIISIILLIAGIGIILYLINIYLFYAITIKRWIKTEGEILESGVEYFRSKTDSDTEGWRQKVVYLYNIKGVDYKNDKITKNISILLPSESSALKSNSYFIGQKITVYYNKNNPKQSVIDPSFNYNSLVLILVSVIAFFVANYVKNE